MYPGALGQAVGILLFNPAASPNSKAKRPARSRAELARLVQALGTREDHPLSFSRPDETATPHENGKLPQRALNLVANCLAGPF